MLILSFSGTGTNSLTLKSLEVLEAHKDVETFDKIIISPTFDYSNFDEVIKKMKEADAIIWAVSPFHMNIQSHMLRFFEEMRKRNIRLSNVNTFFQTNVRVCDNFLSAMLERQIKSVADVFVQGLSYSTSDMVNEKLSLYTLSSPDIPKLFHKSSSYENREGIKTAVQWYKIIKTFANFVKMPNHPHIIATGYSLKVLFVDMNEKEEQHSDFVKTTICQLQKFYKEAGCTVENIEQYRYNVKSCDGCKICYASKECKFKDDFTKYEEKIQEADILIYYGKCEYGFISSLGKKMIDREVHNGLMPVGGKLPSEMTNFRAVGYVLDGDAESCLAFKDYAFCLASFGFQHFLGVITPKAIFNSCADIFTFANYSLLVENERMIPQRNFWTEKVGHHFSDLSKNIPSIIPEEAKYYKKAGGYNPVPVDKNAATITPETFSIGVKMRKIPYDKAIKALNKYH